MKLSTTLLMSLVFTINAEAAVTIPYTFTSGTAAKASEVNENFTALKNAISSNEGVLTYKLSDYLNPTPLTRTFSVTPLGGPSSVASLTVIDNSDGTDVSVWKYSADGATFEATKETTAYDSTGVYSTAYAVWTEDASENVTGGSQDLSAYPYTPYLLTPSTLTLGQSWGLEKVDFTSGGTPTGEFYYSGNMQFLGVENLTIGGESKKCLKVRSDWLSDGNYYSWYCEGIGFSRFHIDNKMDAILTSYQ